MTTEELAREAFGVYKKSLAEAREQDLVQPWGMITPAMREAFTESVRFILKSIHEDEVASKIDIDGAVSKPPLIAALDGDNQLDTVFVEVVVAHQSAKRVQELRDKGYRITATAGDWVLMCRN